MIRAAYLNAKGSFTTTIPSTHWKAALKDAGGVLWVDINEEPTETITPLLREVFDFHPLAVDDALDETHLPKVDNWGDYLYLALSGLHFDPHTLAVHGQELDMFVGQNYLVTLRFDGATPSVVDRLWNLCQSNPHHLKRGPDHLVYELLDLSVADYLPAVDVIDRALDALEDDLFNRPNQKQVTQLLELKRSALSLARIFRPQMDVVSRLARDDFGVIDAPDRIYFRDIYDHLTRLVQINEGQRELITGMLTIHLSVVSNRTNDTMKVLTLLSALFLPISFLSGFFGMNFTHLPFGDPAFMWFAIALMAAIPTAMLLYFSRRGWL